QLSVYLQASPSNHTHLPSPRLRSRAGFVSPCDRTTRAKATGDSHSASAFADTRRRKTGAAQVPGAIAAGFPVCHRISPCWLAPATSYSAGGKVPHLLGLGRYHSAQRAKPCAVRISAVHHRFSLPAFAWRLRDQIRRRWWPHPSLRKITLETRSRVGKLVAENSAASCRRAQCLGICRQSLCRVCIGDVSTSLRE